MTGLAHVAIDGPAGSGKTTVAHALARRLGILYLDTGAMYRAVALVALRADVDPADRDAVVALARERPIHAEVDPAHPLGFKIFAGDDELGEELYGNDVSRIVSVVAAQAEIRHHLVERQREIAARRAVIMAGRDIGTVVLPEAPFKFYLTASVDERVERRLAELAARGNAVDRATLRREIVARDRLDEEREVSPLRPAPDAIEIDSTGMPVDVVVERMAAIVRGAA